MSVNNTAADSRIPEHEVEPLIWQRWSPRAMSGEAIADQELLRLFEAARWAPSCFNEQPWRFLYAHREGPHWDRFVGLLADANRTWAERAGVLVVTLSKTQFSRNGKPNRTHAFDTGAAWQNLALQGAAMNLVVHGMAGFDYDRAQSELDVPRAFRVEMMFAVGRPGDPALLPGALLERENPSQRRPVSDFVGEGSFRWNS